MYVLQTLSGKEDDVKKRLDELGFNTLVPKGFKYKRVKSQWQEVTEVIFKGYVFVNMTYTAENYYKLVGTDGVIRLLRAGDTPLKLTNLEEEWVRVLNQLGEKPTLIELKEDKSIIKSGVLSNFETSITKIDKHKKTATLEIQFLNESHKINLGIEIV